MQAAAGPSTWSIGRPGPTSRARRLAEVAWLADRPSATANEVALAPGHRGAIAIGLTVALGLALDQKVEIWGQLATGIWCWGLVLWLAHRARGELRTMLIACLAISTAGEVFASLFWGLYTYRLGNVPPFIPPGHVLMWLAALYLAAHGPRWLVGAAIGLASAWAGFSWYSGVGRISVPMAGLFLATLLLGGFSRVCAATFLLALPLELYGTWLGNWTWAKEAPWIHLGMTNPPVCAGGLYCVRDALVVLVAARIGRAASGKTPLAGAAVSAPLR